MRRWSTSGAYLRTRGCPTMSTHDLQSDDHDVWVVIPARGGSQGVLRKNLQEIDGVSLVVRTILAAEHSDSVDRVIVTTDDDEIAGEARLAGAEVVNRPAELASGSASSESAVLHALSTLAEAGGDAPAITLLLQCTSPFTTAEDIDACTRHIRDEGADCAITVAASHDFLWTREPAGASPVGHELARRPMRQELDPTYAETGAVYAMRTAGLVDHQTRFFGRVALHEVEPWRALQIDEPGDLETARALAQLQHRSAPVALPGRVSAVVLDFDGVMTDDLVLTHEDGSESVRSSRGDGMGIELLRRAGIPIFVLSKETNPVVKARCDKLRIPVEQGLEDKTSSFEQLLDREGLAAKEVVFVGNDVNDLGCLRAAGCGAAVADAHPEALDAAGIVLSRPGGRGAVRELSELILQHLNPD